MKLEEIEELIQQHKGNEIDLCYFDKSGFTLEPCVPYAWQPTGETIEIPSSKSKRLNVLGFVNRDCEFKSFVFEGGVPETIEVPGLLNKRQNQNHLELTLIRTTDAEIEEAVAKSGAKEYKIIEMNMEDQFIEFTAREKTKHLFQWEA